MKLLFVLLFLWSLQAQAQEVTYSAKAQLWQSLQCLNQSGDFSLCELPKAISPVQTLEFKFLTPVEFGKNWVGRQKLKFNDYQTNFELFWVQNSESQTPYLILQLQVLKKDGSLVALCTRYELPQKSFQLPLGACAGPDGTQVIGLTLSQ